MQAKYLSSTYTANLPSSTILRPSFHCICSSESSTISLLFTSVMSSGDLGFCLANWHRCHMAAKFGLFVDEDHSKLPTLYWLPKLHKRPYKSRFSANSSACTTTELSILLTSCLTAIKNHVIKYCTTVYERNGKNLFWSIKNSGEILNKLKSRGFLASGLSTYDFSTLYTTLPHNLIKEKLTELIEQTFNREGSLYLACNDKNAFLLLNNLNDINCGHVRKCVMRSIIFWTIYL